MKAIKEYLEYRDYLRDFFISKKEEKSFFSYRYIGSKVSIDASHLVKICQKHRHISDKKVDTFIRFCDLKGSDAEYFAALVRFNKSKNDKNAKQAYEHLLSLKGINAYTLEKGQYEYYQKWYYSAILTLLDFYPFRGNYKELAAKLSPKITVAQARKAVKLLKDIGLIIQKRDGTFELTNRIVTTGEHCRSIVARTFQEETMLLAIESLYRHPKDVRNISTVTITISRGDLDTINEMIREFRTNLLKFAEEVTAADRVYQLNVQLFPLTE